jgi:UDP-glucose 4-epimerase
MSRSSKPYALVTGAAGFLGVHVTRQLIAEGRFSLVALDDLSGGFREHLPETVEFVHASINDVALLQDLFRKYKFKYIYHLAAYAAEGLSHFIRRFNYANNLIGSVNLINEAVKVSAECFVFTSSIAVYGSQQPPMTEQTFPKPEDPYGIAKFAVEMDLRAAHEMFGLDYVIFRPHNVYGEYQNLSDPYRNVIGIFVKQIRHNQPMTIFGDGEQQRAFTYVDDVAPAIARSPFVDGARNEIFNIGADKPHTVKEVAAAVAEAMGKPNHPIQHLPARNEVRHAYSDHSKARGVFLLEDETTLANGLARMAAWASRVNIRPLEPFSQIEVEKSMPPSWLKYLAHAQ